MSTLSENQNNLEKDAYMEEFPHFIYKAVDNAVKDPFFKLAEPGKFILHNMLYTYLYKAFYNFISCLHIIYDIVMRIL